MNGIEKLENTGPRPATVGPVLKKKSGKRATGASAEGEQAWELGSKLPENGESVITGPAEHSQSVASRSWPKSANAKSGGAAWVPSFHVDANVVEFKRGKDAVAVHSDRITGSTGSPEEAEKMLEMGLVKGWNPMAFSGDAAFKASVMRAALENRLQVVANNDDDRKLLKSIEKEFKRPANQTPQLGEEKSETAQLGEEKSKTAPAFEKKKTEDIVTLSAENEKAKQENGQSNGEQKKKLDRRKVLEQLP